MNLCLVPAENRIKIVPSERLNGRLDVLSLLQSGTAQAGAASSLTLNTLASALQDVYSGLGATVQITSGTGAGQERNVVSSRKNLVSWGEDFSNAVYSSSVASRTAELITANHVSFGGLVRRSFTYLALTTYVQSVFAKAGTASVIGLRPSGDAAATGDFYAHYDLTSGIATTVVPRGGTINAVGMSDASAIFGAGWWRCWIVFTMSAAPNTPLDTAITQANGAINYIPAGTETVHLKGAQLEVGLAPSDYVKTVANAAVGVAVDVPWVTQPDATSNYLLQLLTSASRRSRVPAENRLYMVH